MRRRFQRGSRRGGSRKDWVANNMYWGPGPYGVPAPGYQMFELVGFKPSSQTYDPPSLSTCTVLTVRGRVDVYSPAGGTNFVAMGIYKATWDAGAGNWEIQFPQSAADASRDNWLWLDSMTITGVTPASSSCDSRGFGQIHVKAKRRLVSGEAIIMIVQNNADSATTVEVVPYLRTLITRVA